MQIFNIHQAKTQLSKLIEKVQNGDEVIIAKAGKPVAKLSSYKQPLKPPFHKDPFDRILISQAKVENLTLISSDQKIWKYNLSLLKA